MADAFKTIKVTQTQPGGPLLESLVGAISATSATAADAGKVILTNASGTLDSSFGGGGGAHSSSFGGGGVHSSFGSGGAQSLQNMYSTVRLQAATAIS